MSIESMKQVLKDTVKIPTLTHGVLIKLSDVEQVIAEAEKQEPVAFLVDGDLYYPEEIDWETLQEQGHTVAPLYTSPPAQQEPTEWLTGCPECGMDGGCDCDEGTWNPPAQQEPPWWPAVENILNEYGLQAIDFVADFKAAQRKPLTDEEVEEVWKQVEASGFRDIVQRFARALEAAHGIKEDA